jgi:hypothetical protein
MEKAPTGLCLHYREDVSMAWEYGTSLLGMWILFKDSEALDANRKFEALPPLHIGLCNVNVIDQISIKHY